MADQRYTAGDDTQRQAAGATSGPGDDRSTGGATRGERERSIATGKEAPRTSGTMRRPSGASLRTLSPFSFMRRMTEDMDRLFDNFVLGRSLGLGPPFAESDRDLWRGGMAEAPWAPQVETFRRGDKLVVRADLPGLKKEDVTVEANDGMLTITGERCDEHEDTKDDYYRSERSYGRFFRALPLPEGVTSDQIDATFKDGVLEVSIPAPKQPEKKSRQVQIR
jgi:HSP20 family protein